MIQGNRELVNKWSPQFNFDEDVVCGGERGDPEAVEVEVDGNPDIIYEGDDDLVSWGNPQGRPKEGVVPAAGGDCLVPHCHLRSRAAHHGCFGCFSTPPSAHPLLMLP